MVNGRPLLDHVLQRLRPQVAHVVLSVGQNSAAYQGFGCEVVTDADANQGPLGGLVSACACVTSEWMLTWPGDAPCMAMDLATRLAVDARARGVAVAHDGRRRQNLCMLLDNAQAASLTDFYHAGGRAVHRWLDSRSVPATDLSEIGESFMNINIPADLEAFRRSAHESG